MRLTVVIPTHNPHLPTLRKTLSGLRDQSLPVEEWELILIDNCSESALAPEVVAWHPHGRVVEESQVGLTSARFRGFREASGELIVMVDDDNVLDSEYLSNALKIADEFDDCGAFGGRSIGKFATAPPNWLPEFYELLALRDLGANSIISDYPQEAGYPICSPIGAGMIVRHSALSNWMNEAPHSKLSDRKGASLSSGGDNEIVMSILQSGHQVGYFPELTLQHLIPAERTTVEYLSRLNESIQFSWMHVLYRNNLSPWPQINPLGAKLRCLIAWFRYYPWKSPAAKIRYRGAKGHFLGRVA